MANIQTLDPTASPLDYYGWELRRQREAHGPKQGQLGEITFCTGSLIGQIETTKKIRCQDRSRVSAFLAFRPGRSVSSPEREGFGLRTVSRFRLPLLRQ
ncbi:hypothetical protein ACWFQQ_31595, partial [Streptomyces sp. NPDC055185]